MEQNELYLEEKKFTFHTQGENMLNNLLTERREAASSRFDENTQNIMSSATKELQTGGYADRAANIGFSIPNTTMLSFTGKTIKLHDCIKNMPTIIIFFRGTWCPYCNFQLREYIKVLEGEKSVNLIAISPEKPDVTKETVDINETPFTMLSDENNVLATQLSLVFTLPEDLQQVYSNIGINVEKSQGNADFRLPIPATYIVDANATIVKAWLNVDYTYRAEPSEVIAEYKKM